jgi:hypothetical protein
MAVPHAAKPGGGHAGWSFPFVLPFLGSNRLVDAGLSLLAMGLVFGGVAYCIAMAIGGFRARRALRL